MARDRRVDPLGQRRSLDALTEHLSPYPRFADVRHHLVMACSELSGQFGIEASDSASVQAAVDATPDGRSGRFRARERR